MPFIAKFSNPMKILFLHLSTLTVYRHCTTVWKAVDLNLSDADSLDQPIMRTLSKVFTTYDRSVLHWCMFYFGYMPAQSAMALRKFKFLFKLKLSCNTCVNTLTNVCIMQDLDKIVCKFEIHVNVHFHSIENKLLFDFGSTLSLS